MLWFGRSDPCNSAGKVAARDARVTPPLQRADLQQLLSSNPLPTCGGVVFYHLPKSAGSSVECFLGAQPHFACCYRTTCGFCRTSARGGQCQHRGLLPSGLRSRWADSPQGRNVTPFFVLPSDLLRFEPTSRISDRAFLRSLRFVTSVHFGPTSVSASASQVLPFIYLRDSVFRSAGCKLVLATWLRHPARQLISAWHYNGRRGDLFAFAQSRAGALLGMSNTLYRNHDGFLVGVKTAPPELRSAYISNAIRVEAVAAPAVMESLLSVFDVVGHVERFDESLLTLIDAAGLQAVTACPLADNTRACGMKTGARAASGRADTWDDTRVHGSRSRESRGRRGTDAASSCYEENASHLAVVADAIPHLVRWYDQRLLQLDRSIQTLGPSFQARVERLRRLRREAGAAVARRGRMQSRRQ